MSTIVKIDPKEFGLEEKKAEQIAQQFKPMLDKMQELEVEFNQVAAMEMSQQKVKQAKELRLKYVKVRTGTADIHKEQKAFYRAGGLFIDGWKNAQLFASQGIEEKLSEIESYYARIEAERIQNLRTERWEMLKPYIEVEPVGLGVMEWSTFAHLLSGAKTAHEAKIEAEKKAEAERIERDKKEAEEREAQRLENIRLKAEAEAREKAIAEERRKQAEKESAERKDRERIQAEADAKLKAEREAREKAEAELRAQAEAKEKARKQAEAEAKKAAKAPSQKRLKTWIETTELPTLNTDNFTPELFQARDEIQAKFIAFKAWAYNLIENK